MRRRERMGIKSLPICGPRPLQAISVPIVRSLTPFRPCPTCKQAEPKYQSRPRHLRFLRYPDIS